jgi:hypothetical protein
VRRCYNGDIYHFIAWVVSLRRWKTVLENSFARTSTIPSPRIGTSSRRKTKRQSLMKITSSMTMNKAKKASKWEWYPFPFAPFLHKHHPSTTHN